MTRLDQALRVQLGYAALVFVWQIAGVLAIAAGGRPPGPSASWTTAAIAVAIGAGLVCGRRRALPLYAALSALSGAAAILTLHNAFTADPALWPSDASRYAGVAINLVGVGGAIAAAAGLAGHYAAGSGREADR